MIREEPRIQVVRRRTVVLLAALGLAAAAGVVYWRLSESARDAGRTEQGTKVGTGRQLFESSGVIVAVEGTGNHYRPARLEDWKEVVLEQIIAESSVLRTLAASTLSMLLDQETGLWLQEKSQLFLEKLERRPDGHLRIAADLRDGRVYGKVKARRSGDSFLLRTPQAVLAVRGTRFAVEVAGGVTRLAVDQGAVEVRSASIPGDVQVVTAGRTLSTRPRPVIHSFRRWVRFLPGCAVPSRPMLARAFGESTARRVEVASDGTAVVAGAPGRWSRGLVMLPGRGNLTAPELSLISGRLRRLRDERARAVAVLVTIRRRMAAALSEARRSLAERLAEYRRIREREFEPAARIVAKLDSLAVSGFAVETDEGNHIGIDTDRPTLFVRVEAGKEPPRPEEVHVLGPARPDDRADRSAFAKLEGMFSRKGGAK